MRRRLNTDEKRALQAAEVQHFARQYARKAQRGIEPNDRRYDRQVERRIRTMAPEALDGLLRDGEE